VRQIIHSAEGLQSHQPLDKRRKARFNAFARPEMHRNPHSGMRISSVISFSRSNVVPCQMLPAAAGRRGRGVILEVSAPGRADVWAGAGGRFVRAD
jgi:hypothetical protein